MHPDIKIQVNNDKKQSTWGSSSTILHPLTEVRGRKIFSNSQQAKSVDRSSILSPGTGTGKTVNKRENCKRISKLSKLCSKTLGSCSTILHSLSEVKGWKITVNKPTLLIVRTSFLHG